MNDLIDCCEKFSDIYLFADDAKIFHHILHPGDQQILQNGVNELLEWTQRWILTLNIKKCLLYPLEEIQYHRTINNKLYPLKEALLSGI